MASAPRKLKLACRMQTKASSIFKEMNAAFYLVCNGNQSSVGVAAAVGGWRRGVCI